MSYAAGVKDTVAKYAKLIEAAKQALLVCHEIDSLLSYGGEHIIGEVTEELEMALGIQHASDCALHNRPAKPTAKCDCEALRQLGEPSNDLS